MDKCEEAGADHGIIDKLPLCVGILGHSSNQQRWLQQKSNQSMQINLVPNTEKSLLR